MVSKSQAMAWQQCPKRVWLAKNRRELAAEQPAGLEARRQVGLRLNALAHTLWPGGVRSFAQTVEESAAQTRELAERGVPAIFEAQFFGRVGGVETAARADVIENSPNGWRLIEVKSSREAKEHHFLDLAFQVNVARASGFDIRSCAVLLVSANYVFDGGVHDPKTLFRILDVTEDVYRRLEDAKALASGAEAVLCTSDCPTTEVGRHCDGPPCPFRDHCWADVPHDSLHYFPGLRGNVRANLFSKGIRTIGEMGETKMNPAQLRVYDTVRFDRPFVSGALAGEIGALKFPIAFVDFETINFSLPLLEGTRPFEQTPFQFSVHILDSMESDARHFEYLHTEPTFPLKPFARSLHDVLSSAKTLVHYSPYEVTIARNLAKAGVPLGQEVSDLFQNRGYDLLGTVKEHVYMREFLGSYSIKRVLPALVPGLDYKDLAIQDGDTAMAMYASIFADGLTEARRQSLIDDLLAYCKRDTEAMVALYRALYDLSL